MSTTKGKKSGSKKAGKKSSPAVEKLAAASYIDDEAEEDEQSDMEQEAAAPSKTVKKKNKGKTGDKRQPKKKVQEVAEEEDADNTDGAEDDDDDDDDKSSSEDDNDDDVDDAPGKRKRDEDELAEDMTVSSASNLGWDPLSNCPVAVNILQPSIGNRRDLVELEFTNPPNIFRLVTGKRIRQYSLASDSALHLNANIKAISRTASHIQLYVPTLNRQLYTFRNPIYDLSTGSDIILDIINICKREIVFKAGDVIANGFVVVAPPINFSLHSNSDHFQSVVDAIVKEFEEDSIGVSEKYSPEMHADENIFLGGDGCRLIYEGIWSSKIYAKINTNHPNYSS